MYSPLTPSYSQTPVIVYVFIVITVGAWRACVAVGKVNGRVRGMPTPSCPWAVCMERVMAAAVRHINRAIGGVTCLKRWSAMRVCPVMVGRQICSSLISALTIGVTS